MEIRETESSGRELVIKFTCRRCGKETYLPFKNAMKGDTYGYLHNSEVPKGWRGMGLWNGLICEECAGKFDEFMNPGRQARAAEGVSEHEALLKQD